LDKIMARYRAVPLVLLLHSLVVAALPIVWCKIENVTSPPPLGEQDHRVGPSIYFTRDMGSEQQVELGIGAFAGLTRGAPAAMLKFNVSISAERK
jgi:hypothetical protein